MNDLSVLTKNILGRLEMDTVGYIETNPRYAVLPRSCCSDFVLYPNHAILVIKAEDLRVLSIGKRVSALKKLMTLDFYDERISFFRHQNHLGHVTFVNMTYQDLLDIDPGQDAMGVAFDIFQLFGDLNISRNYGTYRRANINSDYRFLSIKDAEPMIAMNNRVLAVVTEDGTIEVVRVINRRR